MHVKRLQTALQALAKRVRDPAAGTPVDGLVGPHTVRAVNYAVPKHTAAPSVLANGRLTHTQIVSFSPQLSAFVEKAPVPGAGDGLLTPAFMTTTAQAPPVVLPSTPASTYTPNSGGRSQMPAQYYQPGYAPAPYYPPSYQPGYQPGYAPAPRQASVDIKAFIPAQYEHVKFNPVTLAALAAAVVVTVVVMQRKGEKK